MEKLFNWLQSLPKAVQAIIVGALFIGIGFGIYKYAFGNRGKTSQQESGPAKNEIALFPDGNEEKTDRGKLEELRNAEQGGSAADRYWASLAEEDGNNGDGGLMPGGSSSGGRNDGNYYKGEYLDPTVYSEMEIENIKKGIFTKADVDRRHEIIRRAEEAAEAERKKDEEKRKADPDSLYFARMEKAMAIAQKYSRTPDSQATPAPEPVKEPEPRKIDLAAAKIPSTTLVEDGIITSLDSEPTTGQYHGGEDGMKMPPAKATFLKSETLTSGQRVIMRLMQDLHLSDGTVIPINTHISGTCEINKRLGISVTTINYGGKIYYTNLNVFDNDGTEGIYCPVIAQKGSSKSAKNIGKQVGQSAASLLSSALTSSPYLANIATTGVNEITQSIDRQGNITVNVTSGYEFYLFEEIKEH